MDVAAPVTDDAMVPSFARVRRRRRETPEVWTLALDPPASWRGFAPGQFNMIGIPGVGEAAISLSGDPRESDRIVHTIRAVGPVSRALAALRQGDRLSLRGPFGRGWPMALEGRDVVVIAGGLGLAPVRPALLALLRHRRRFGRLTLLYGARTPTDVMWLPALERWRAKKDIDIEVTVDRAGADWAGHVGVVTRLLAHARFDPVRTSAIVCGPEVMMRFAAHALTDAGVADTSIHLSMERNMKCGVGLCGHCQLGPHLICRDGPVFDWRRMRALMAIDGY
ncbi:MAG: FAD/NAD(P)-binding protein [Burkholderiaceae bacterium]